MYIKNEMIHPELRRRGRLIRRVMPFFKTKSFYICAKVQKFMKGIHSRELHYEQIWISRPHSAPESPKLRLCVYGPKDRKEQVPGLLWIHGGGYAMGIPEQDDGFIKNFVRESGCIVVSPDYRLSTKAPYPAALEDCYTALLWLKEHALLYGVRSDQLMIGGDSAGGGLTAALSIYARDQGEVAISFQMPLYPMLDDRMITESLRKNDAPVWNSKSNENAWKLYLGELYGTDDVPTYAAPARLTEYHNLPPAFTFVGSIEPFRDETIAYMEHLKAAGIPVEYHVFPGCFHAFDQMCKNSTPARTARKLLMKNFRYAIEHYFATQPENLTKQDAM